MRASSVASALAALSADQESQHHQFMPSHQQRYGMLPPKLLQSNKLLDRNVALRQMALIGRGGGRSFSSTSVLDTPLSSDIKRKSSKGSASKTSVADIRGGAEESGGKISILGLSISPQALATLSMATCMALHYLAYSLARPATMTLFTSTRLGFGNSRSAYPFAMTFISPMSFALLLFYGSVLNRQGPYLALKSTTIGCAAILGLCGALIAKLDPLVENNANVATLTRYIVGALFIFRESYVQLITSQHWSFISSVLTPNQSSTWFAPISGLTSVTSALAAMGVGKLSSMWGLQGVIGVAAVVLACSVIFGEMAYSIAEKVSLESLYHALCTCFQIFCTTCILWELYYLIISLPQHVAAEWIQPSRRTQS